MKLAWKLTLALLAGIWTVLAVHAFLELGRERDLFREDLADDLRIIGRSLRPAVQRIWEKEGQLLALQVLDYEDETARRVNIRWTWLAAPEGDPARPVLDAERSAMVAGGEEVFMVDEEEGRAGRAYLYVPVALEALPAGALELSESLVPERDYLRTTLLRLAITYGAIALVSGLIAIVIGLSMVGRPMRLLARRARGIGEGDLQTRLTVTQGDEIGQLAAEMNSMCERLGEAQQRLEGETGARIAALEQLRHADRLMTVGKLASGIAHELGTPLNVVGGRARMIQRGEVDGAQSTDSARIIAEQAERMTRIIRQLLDFARPRNAQKSPHTLATLAAQAAGLLRPMAVKKNVEVQLDLPEGLPPLELDEGQITQVLTNLMVNAIHAMPDGGRLTLKVDVRNATPPPEHGGPPGPWQVVEVRDTGGGIAPEHLTRIFEPFFTTKPVGEGTGLGLSVTHGMVRDHGGWVDVESRLGEGSCFSVYLPQA